MPAPEGNDTLTASPPAVRSTGRRSLVLVAGSGRSGTSLFAGTLQRLGFHVPQPEVPADDTNPRGFAESKWVVDFHTRLLRRARVQVADARPTAWAKTAEVALDAEVARELREWLAAEIRASDGVVIKDPRLSWFLPLWRRSAEELGVKPSFVTVIRHPAAVVQSKQRSYGGWQGEVSRTAGWLNLVLFTERATRGAPRTFVRYDDLLDDWTLTVNRVAEALDLAAVRDASPVAMRRVHEFVDRSLSRSGSSWDDIEIPTRLREQADHVWGLLSELADHEADAGLDDRLDAARSAYAELYEDAEAIAHSSIVAAQHGGGAARARRSSATVGVVRRVVPPGVRRRVPARWRRAVAARLRAGRR